MRAVTIATLRNEHKFNKRDLAPIQQSEDLLSNDDKTSSRVTALVLHIHVPNI